MIRFQLNSVIEGRLLPLAHASSTRWLVELVEVLIAIHIYIVITNCHSKAIEGNE